MKTLLALLWSASFLWAQSQAVECGSTAGVAAAAAPSAGSSTAAKASTETAEPATKSGSAAASVAAQIQPRRPAPPSNFSCRCGTVSAASLIAKSATLEVPILRGLTGSFRFDHVLLQESTRFTSSTATSLVVGVGRANLEPDVIQQFALMSGHAPANSWYERPTPPQLTGGYDLALYFKATAPLGDGTASNFSAGTVAWEVCGYTAPLAPAR